MKNLIILILLFTGINVSGQVAINDDGSVADNSAMLDVKSTNKGFLPPRMTHLELNLIPDPIDGLQVYCTDCGSNGSGALSIFINGSWYIFDLTCLNPASPAAGVHVSTSSQIIWKWNGFPNVAGYKWNSINDYNTATEMGSNTSYTEDALICNTEYTRYVWAYNTCGISMPIELNQITSPCFTCSTLTINHIAGEVAPVSKTVTYETVTNVPGDPLKCWIAHNLGADHQAATVDDNTEASAGWYWQFNRKQGYKHDGFIRTPNTIWITENCEPIQFWQVSNDPCALELGDGWHIATYYEWLNVNDGGGWSNCNDAFASVLKLHDAGMIGYNDGILYHTGGPSNFWSHGSGSQCGGLNMNFGITLNGLYEVSKAAALPVRCVKDL